MIGTAITDIDNVRPGAWQRVDSIGSKTYECAYCDKVTGVNRGYVATNPDSYIYLCAFCNRPTFFIGKTQVPAPMLGSEINNLPESINMLYQEIRACTSVGAYTATVMLCRKLLMNISVEEGADEGLFFVQYIQFLEDKGYTPPKSKAWVKAIKDVGNEANHKIEPKGYEDAVTILAFVDMLLRYLYEVPEYLQLEQESG